MSKDTSSTIFKKLVNSPVGIIAEFIANKLASEYGYEPLKNYFLEIQTGKTPPMSNPEYYSSNDIEWIKPSDIGFEKYITASDWISNKAVKENKATIYKPNTVLIICIGGGIGRLGIVDKICSSNQQITGILFKNEVLAEFVYYFFLSRYKIFEENSSKSTLPIINQKGLGNLDFTCPNISMQKEVVRFLEYCKECLDEFSYPTNSSFELSSEVLEFSKKAFKAFYTQRSLLSEYENQLTQLENLNQAILQEAVQGKLVKQNPKDEPASELLKRIKAEKAKTDKKEKPLPPIKPEEIPFDIPENWVWCRLGEICSKIGSGSTPKGSNYSKNGFPFFRSQNIYNDGLVYDDIKFVSDEVQKQMSGTVVKANDILLNITGGSMGRCALVPEDFDEGNVSQHVCIIRPLQVDRNYFNKIVLSSYFQKFIFSSTTGAGREGLPKYNLERFVIPLPSLSEQKRIVAEIETQLAKIKQLKEHIISNQQATEQLLKALLHQAFEIKNKKGKEKPVKQTEGKVFDLKPTNVDYYRRTVLAAEIVWQLHKEPTLGHLKLQKLIYLCQKSAEMQLPTNFLRQAMGPYDPKLMRSIDKQLKEKKWFEYYKEGDLKYQPLEKAGEHHDDFIKYFSAESNSIQFIIDKFKTIKSERIEIVATLYACLDNMSDNKEIFSEALLIKRFYEWSDRKKRFEEAIVKQAFLRMVETGIVPKNYSMAVTH